MFNSYKTRLLPFFFGIFFFFVSFCKPVFAQTLFYDDFEDGNSTGWTEVNPSGTWQVQGGDYIGAATLVQIPGLPSYSVNGDFQWQNYNFETKIKGTLGIDKQVLFRVNQQENRSYIFNFRSSYFNGGNDAILAKRSPLGSGNASLLKLVPFTSNPNQVYKLNAIVKNENLAVHIKIYIDDNLIIDYTDTNNPIYSGAIGFEVVPGGYQPNPIGLTTETHYQYALVKEIEAPLPVPNLKQYDPLWNNTEYDTASVWSPGKTGIGRWGCALTSATMMLQYYGYNISVDGLNTWLLQNNGYITPGLVNFSAVTRWAKLAHDVNPLLKKLEYQRFTGFDTVKVDGELTNTRPVVLKLVRPDGGTHFLVLTGKNGSDYFMNDPATTNTQLSYYPQSQYVRMDTFTPSNTDLSYIYLYSPANVSVSVVAPNGNTLGGFKDTEGPLIDQTDLSLSNVQPVNSFAFPKPPAGNYLVKVSGNGDYNLTSQIYDIDGNLVEEDLSGDLTNSQSDSYLAVVGATDSFQKIDFEFLKNNISEAYKSGQIKKAAVYKSLIILIDQAEDKYNKNKITPTKVLLDVAILDIKISEKKYMDSSYANELTNYISLVIKSL